VPHESLAGALVVAGLAAYSTSTALGYEPARLPKSEALAPYLRTLFPQGWGFFTKSPRELEIHASSVSRGTLESLNQAPNAQLKWFYGFDRTPRVQEFETIHFVQEMANIPWTSCDGPVTANCLDKARTQSIPILEHPFAHQTYCGSIALVESKPLPWAYANRGFTESRSERIKMLTVQC